MKDTLICLMILLLLTPCAFGRSSRGIHPPPGFHAYRATQYGNEHTRRARRISCSHTASGDRFCPSASTFAMTHALGNKYDVWTPGHPITKAVCNDTGADHPDLAYGFFRRMYYQLPSRSGGRGRVSAEKAGIMTIWMKRTGKVKFRHKK